MWVTNLLSSLQVQRKMIVKPEFPKNTSTAWLAAGQRITEIAWNVIVKHGYHGFATI